MARASKSSTSLRADAAMAVCAAEVTQVDAAGRVRVSRGTGRPVLARAAVDGRYVPRVGDRVLVAEGGRGARYIVAVVARADSPLEVNVRHAPPAPTSSDDALVLERGVAPARTIVRSDADALSVAAPDGALVFAARDGVRVRSGEAVGIVAGLSVRAETKPAAGRAASSLTLGPRGIALATPLMEVGADAAELAAGEVRVVARGVSTTVDVARHVVGVVESRVSRLVERAKNVYRDVQEMAQVRAGRIREVAETTYHLMGERTVIKADEDVKIKGAKIYLG